MADNYREQVRQFVERSGPRGVTVAEVREALNAHHGLSSGALSLLHADGKIARLATRRDGCKVYVSPRCTLDRKTEPQGRGNVIPERIAR